MLQNSSIYLMHLFAFYNVLLLILENVSISRILFFVIGTLI